MDWMEQVKAKQMRRNQILFDRNSVLLLPLRHQIAKQSHIVIVAWCLSCLETLVQELYMRLASNTVGKGSSSGCTGMRSV